MNDSVKSEIPLDWTRYTRGGGIDGYGRELRAPHMLDVVPDVVFSSALYLSGHTQTLNFFNEVRPGANGHPLTSLVIPNMLPAPCAFLIEGIRLHGITTRLSFGVFQLVIGNRIYQRSLAWMYAESRRRAIRPSLMIPPLVCFRASIDWDYPITLGRGLDGQGKKAELVQVCLYGQMARAVQ